MYPASGLVHLALLCLHMGPHFQNKWIGDSKSNPTSVSVSVVAPDPVVAAAPDPAPDMVLATRLWAALLRPLWLIQLARFACRSLTSFLLTVANSTVSL